MEVEVKITKCPVCGYQYFQEDYPQCPVCSGAVRKQGVMGTMPINSPQNYDITEVGGTLPLDTPETESRVRMRAAADGGVTLPPERVSSYAERNIPTIFADDVQRDVSSDLSQKTKPPFGEKSSMGTTPLEWDPPVSGGYSKQRERKERVVGWLVALNGEHKGEDYQLRGYNTTIGRERGNKIVLTGDGCISRTHCAIRYYSDTRTYFIYNLQTASNPIYVNKNPLHDHAELHAYDVIKIGRTELVFIPLCGKSFGWSEAAACD